MMIGLKPRSLVFFAIALLSVVAPSVYPDFGGRGSRSMGELMRRSGGTTLGRDFMFGDPQNSSRIKRFINLYN